MKKLYYICKFEISRLVSNWRNTLKLFLIPAVVMLVALYLFPVLVNYLSTGSLGRTTVIVANAPDSFMPYVKGLNLGTVYDFSEIDYDEVDTPEEIDKLIRKGRIVVTFSNDYERDVYKYFSKLDKYYENYNPNETIKGDMYPKSKAVMNVYFNDNSTFAARSEQLKTDVLEKYNSALPDLLEIESQALNNTGISIDSFNPVTKITSNRIVANLRAGRIIPQIIILMLYYCVYSLSLEIFAGDRDRGFLTKMRMAPISAKTIFAGKILTIEVIAILSSIIIFFMMFLASWLNFSNDALSLLPFGMFMLPSQLLKMFVVCMSAAFQMTALCIWMIFELQKPEDITVNLQLPLATILIELFIFMVRTKTINSFEYLVPIHGSIAALFSIMLSTDTPFDIAVTAAMNIIFALLMLINSLNKEDFK